MFRKTLIAVASVATLGASALVPTAASAHYFFRHHHFSHHYTPRIWVSAPDCYFVKKWTHYGVKIVKVCSYH